MAPLTSQELNLISRDEPSDSASFSGQWNETWTIGSVPQGGYTLCLLIQAAQYWVRLPSSYAHPRAAPHVDPLHVSATYLIPATLKKPFKIVVSPLKRGKGVSLVDVRLLQPSSNETWNAVVIATVYLNNFAARREADPPISGPTLDKDSVYLTRCGLSDPYKIFAEVKPSPGMEKFRFRDVTRFYPDLNFYRRSLENKGPGGNGAAGFWLELSRQGERDSLPKGREHGVGYNWMCLACDLGVFPTAQFKLKTATKDLWFPTLSLSIEFKRRIPMDVLLSRWGNISRNHFLMDGQFDNSCEIWTHPDDNIHLDPPCSPSDGPQILAIARQVGLTTSLSQQSGNKTAHQRSQQRAKI